ncbi:MAG TPA: RNA polymerase sigma factor [Thermoleophilaceae bacterium]
MAAVTQLARTTLFPLRALRRDSGDRALISDAQAGSAEAVELLFRRHWGRAYRAAYLIVADAGAAEDIAQEAFVAGIAALDRFDRRRPFAPWLHRIVVNRAIDWSRARAVRREVLGAPVESPDELRTSGLSDEIRSALEALSPEHRAVVVLRYVLEYTPGEIARLLELPRGTVNSRLRRGLDALEAGLAEAVR